jgi:hypothetical protein
VTHLRAKGGARTNTTNIPAMATKTPMRVKTASLVQLDVAGRLAEDGSGGSGAPVTGRAVANRMKTSARLRLRVDCAMLERRAADIDELEEVVLELLWLDRLL